MLETILGEGRHCNKLFWERAGTARNYFGGGQALIETILGEGRHCYRLFWAWAGTASNYFGSALMSSDVTRIQKILLMKTPLIEIKK